MKTAEIIKRINADLNAHYTSNKGCWWVSNCGMRETIELHKGDINNRLKAVQIAKYIFSKEKSVNIIHYRGGCMIYTRESVKCYSTKKRLA
jgi:hypothetical protein